MHIIFKVYSCQFSYRNIIPVVAAKSLKPSGDQERCDVPPPATRRTEHGSPPEGFQTFTE